MNELNEVISMLERLRNETYLASPAAVFESVAGFMRDDLTDAIDKLKQAEVELQKEADSNEPA